MMSPSQTDLRDDRGAVFVEHLIAFIPVLYFFLVTWQLLELCAADLVMKRAASAAVRAAVVVLPDDPAALGGDGNINSYSGIRQRYVELAARMILQASPSMEDQVAVSLTGSFSDNNPITAEVRAPFRCAGGWLNIVCGGSSARELSASATHVYQGAHFSYDSH